MSTPLTKTETPLPPPTYMCTLTSMIEKDFQANARAIEESLARIVRDMTGWVLVFPEHILPSFTLH